MFYIIAMEEDLLFEEEDIFYDYAFPPEVTPDVSVNASNTSLGLPTELSSEVPSQLTDSGAQSALDKIVTYLNSTLGVDLGDLLTNFAIIFIKIAVIILATYFVARMVSKAINVYLPKMMRAEKVGLDTEQEKTPRTIINRLLVVVIYIMGIVLIIAQIPPLSKVAVTLLAGAGVAGLAVGFAAQGSLSNVISGIFLVVFHPFRVGDYIDFNGEYGQIEDLTLRHTVIEVWDGRRIMVPNSTMNDQAIINWTIMNPEIIWTVNIGIAYTASIDKSREIILDVAKRHPLVLKSREINVRVTELGDFAVNMRLYIHVVSRDVAYSTGCEIMESIKKRFDREGIEIPYPYRNIIIQNPQGGSGPENEENQAS